MLRNEGTAVVEFYILYNTISDISRYLNGLWSHAKVLLKEIKFPTLNHTTWHLFLDYLNLVSAFSNTILFTIIFILLDWKFFSKLHGVLQQDLNSLIGMLFAAELSQQADMYILTNSPQWSCFFLGLSIFYK